MAVEVGARVGVEVGVGVRVEVGSWMGMEVGVSVRVGAWVVVGRGDYFSSCLSSQKYFYR